MATFTINDIQCLMSAVSILYTIEEREEAKKYWNDLGNRLNELTKEMEEEHKKELMRRSITNDIE